MLVALLLLLTAAGEQPQAPDKIPLFELAQDAHVIAGAFATEAFSRQLAGAPNLAWACAGVPSCSDTCRPLLRATRAETFWRSEGRALVTSGEICGPFADEAAKDLATLKDDDDWAPALAELRAHVERWAQDRLLALAARLRPSMTDDDRDTLDCALDRLGLARRAAKACRREDARTVLGIAQNVGGMNPETVPAFLAEACANYEGCGGPLACRQALAELSNDDASPGPKVLAEAAPLCPMIAAALADGGVDQVGPKLWGPYALSMKRGLPPDDQHTIDCTVGRLGIGYKPEPGCRGAPGPVTTAKREFAH